MGFRASIVQQYRTRGQGMKMRLMSCLGSSADCHLSALQVGSKETILVGFVSEHYNTEGGGGKWPGKSGQDRYIPKP